MKKVLVVGEGSYIGERFKKYAHGRLDVTTVGTLHGEWKEIDFNGFDSIVYVAGIAHRKQSKQNKDLYFAVNRDLAVAVAEKAKLSGVRQFIFFSSIAVYGIKIGKITSATVPAPREKDYYGTSKYQAEQLIEPMQDDTFQIAIIRPPMVYGINCKGKFQQLLKIAKLSPFFPTVINKRSMLFIDNLSELLALVVENDAEGIMCPQNSEYVNTSQMLFHAAAAMGKKRRELPLLNLFIRMLMPIIPSIKTAFGSLYYSPEISKMPFDNNYQSVGFEESVKRSVSA